MEAAFATEWLFIYNVCDLKRPGDDVRMEIRDESLIILKGRDGAVRALHDTCRHRGSRICQAGQGCTTIIEEANWKLVIENNRECYLCAGDHAELLATLVGFALPDDPGGANRNRIVNGGRP